MIVRGAKSGRARLTSSLRGASAPRWASEKFPLKQTVRTFGTENLAQMQKDNEESTPDTRDGPQYAHLVTKAVQSGESGGRVSMIDTLTTPIAQTSAYTFKNTAQLIDFCEKRYSSFEYGRYGNPTAKVLEDKMRALEHGDDCLFAASGMSCITTAIMANTPKNGKIVITKDMYRKPREFITQFMPKMGVEVILVDHNTQQIQETILREKPNVFFSESPSNPYLNCFDIPEVAKACKETGTVLIVDSTFATPINQRPLELGADMVIHAASKYLAGHNDVLAGCIIGSAAHVQKCRDLHSVLGGVIDPHAAYLVLRGLKTLGIRIKQQNHTATRLAQHLASMPQIDKVFYPGLASHPTYDVAFRNMDGYGGVVSFVIAGGEEPARRFLDNLRIPYLAPSLGGVESLVEMPWISWRTSEQEKIDLGIEPGLVRFSCGVEDSVDIIADVANALKSC